MNAEVAAHAEKLFRKTSACSAISALNPVSASSERRASPEAHVAHTGIYFTLAISMCGRVHPSLGGTSSRTTVGRRVGSGLSNRPGQAVRFDDRLDRQSRQSATKESTELGQK